MAGHNRYAPLDRAQIRSIRQLRLQRLTVCEIGRRLGLEKSSQHNSIRLICERMGRRHGIGVASTPEYQRVRTGKRGAAP